MSEYETPGEWDDLEPIDFESRWGQDGAYIPSGERDFDHERPKEGSSEESPARKGPIEVESWSLDDSGYYTYLVLNGSHKELRAVMDALQLGGIEVRSAGESHRPAADGRKYDFFVRVGDQLSDGQGLTEQHVARLVTSRDRSPQETLQQQLKALRKELRLLKMQVSDRIEALAREQADKQNLARKLELQSNRYANLLETYQQADNELGFVREQLRAMQLSGSTERADMLSRIAELASRLDKAMDSEKTSNELGESYAADLKKLQSDYDSLKQDDEGRKKNFSRLEKKHESLREAYELLQDKYEDKCEQLHSMSSADEARSIANIVSALLPDVEFLNGSSDILERELPDPRDLLGQLGSVIRGERQNGKRIRGTRNWWEAHFDFAKPGDDRGRVYWRFGQGKPRKIRVLVSEKKTQERDIKWMQKHDANA